tara:strand:- start:26 stop:289 length:264 start_codon:yes stop_codon:yes gene_type:complete
MPFILNPYYFFISLVIGLFFAYIFTPTPEVIIRYPTPENAGKIIYQDTNDICYKYKAEEVQCPSDKSKIKTEYLQDGKKMIRFFNLL